MLLCKMMRQVEKKKKKEKRAAALSHICLPALSYPPFCQRLSFAYTSATPGTPKRLSEAFLEATLTSPAEFERGRRREAVRARWRKVVQQQMLLLRIEQENERLQAACSRANAGQMVHHRIYGDREIEIDKWEEREREKERKRKAYRNRNA